MPRCIKDITVLIVDLKNKINKAKTDKMGLLQAHEDEGKLLLFHFRKYNKKKYYNKNVYLAYNKLKRFNNKNRKLSDKLKDMYGINVGTDNPKCAEPPNSAIKCADCNRRPIQNCMSVYQMQLCTVSISLVIVRIPFSFIKESRSSDPIDYLL